MFSAMIRRSGKKEKKQKIALNVEMIKGSGKGMRFRSVDVHFYVVTVHRVLDEAGASLRH